MHGYSINTSTYDMVMDLSGMACNEIGIPNLPIDQTCLETVGYMEFAQHTR